MKSSLLVTRIAVSVGITVLLAALAIPAAAVEPFRYHQTQTISTNWECPGGVLIPGVVTFNTNGIVFKDAAGFTTHVILHDSIDQSYVGPTGIIASGTNTQNETFDVNTGAFSVRGVLTNLRVAGIGIVAHVAGQIKVDAEGNATFTASFDHARPSGVCEALLP